MTHIDTPLYLALNFDGGPTVDMIFHIITDKLTWIPLYLLLLYLFWRKYDWRGFLLCIAVVVLSVVVTDHFANLFKTDQGIIHSLFNGFEPRLRPRWALEGITHFVPHSSNNGQFGTVSSHASTLTGIAVLCAALLHRRWLTFTLAGWVLLVCYSRIYVAAHYPLDLTWGILVGLVFGFLLLWMTRRVLHIDRFLRKPAPGKPDGDKTE